MSGFEENEISLNSQGGTESVKRGLAERLDPELLKDFQIICSRVRHIEEDKIRVYWLHDLPEDPETNHIKDAHSRDRFHQLVFCGNWQYSRYQLVCGVPYNTSSIVIDTPIEPAPLVEKDFSTIRLMYTSTPQRGLNILVPVFEELAKTHKNIHLDVFSSFKIYGWEQADTQYEPIYERIRNHPQMTYHGFAPNEIVKEHLLQAHIHAYPSIWLECNSRSVIEAMSSGLLCVHPNYGGLTDTSGGMNFMYQGDQDLNKHASIFYHALDHAIKRVSTDDVQQHLRLTKLYADSRYSWDRITSIWTDLLLNLKDRYPTIESRKVQDKFYYET
ncbi:glycosyltransferase family 1 protein [bacterium]|nr:glycosyltransferase family 1 protein [Candidatus Elulimicrobium humile]